MSTGFPEFLLTKSNFSIKNLNRSIMTLLIIFASAVEPYFCVGENQRSKIAKFILKLTLRKFIKFDKILYKTDDLLIIRWKRMDFTIGLLYWNCHSKRGEKKRRITFANFDLWSFPTQKYGSTAPPKIIKSVVIEWLRFLIEKLLFLLSKIIDLCTHLSLRARDIGLDRDRRA